MNRAGIFIALLSFAISTECRGAIILLNETFTSSAALTSSGWTDTTGGTFEVYAVSGASARGMASTYDHDNDTLTAAINIPSGIEVNDTAANVTLTATITLPAEFDPGTGLLTFWAGSRGDITPQTFNIFNVTDSTSILASTNVTLNNAGNPNQWQFNSFNNIFSAADFGDTIQLRFVGNGTGAQGLQLADLDFTVEAVPEPSAIMLWATLGLSLLGFQRFKRANRAHV